MKEEILNRYFEENLLIADGFDDAIIGIEQDTMRIIYSVKKCVLKMQRNIFISM